MNVGSLATIPRSILFYHVLCFLQPFCVIFNDGDSTSCFILFLIFIGCFPLTTDLGWFFYFCLSFFWCLCRLMLHLQFLTSVRTVLPTS